MVSFPLKQGGAFDEEHLSDINRFIFHPYSSSVMIHIVSFSTKKNGFENASRAKLVITNICALCVFVVCVFMYIPKIFGCN